MLFNFDHNFTLQLNLYLISNIVEYGVLTGTPSVVIISVSLIWRISKWEQIVINNRIERLRVRPAMANVNSTVRQVFAVPSSPKVLPFEPRLQVVIVLRPINVPITSDLAQAFANVVSSCYIIAGDRNNISSGSSVPASFDSDSLGRYSRNGTSPTEISLRYWCT